MSGSVEVVLWLHEYELKALDISMSMQILIWMLVKCVTHSQ